jgi:polyhydroxybutyrate depolymerase
MDDSVEVGGRTRTFTVVGAADPAASRDLILIFHGSKQDGAKHRKFTGGMFDALAENHAAVVAYLDGYRGNWNDARLGSRFPARLEDVDDVGFVRAVIERLADSLGGQWKRVFAVGYSNGGQMVMRLVHEAPGLLAGAAVIAATLPAPENFLLPGAIPAATPVLLIHGTKDPIVDYRGGELTWWARKMFKVGGRSLSMPDTADYFASHNGITTKPTTAALPRPAGAAGGTWVELTAYHQEGRPPVALYTVHGGGHTVPGPRKAPFVLGRTSQDVNTAELLAEFFDLP